MNRSKVEIIEKGGEKSIVVKRAIDEKIYGTILYMKDYGRYLLSFTASKHAPLWLPSCVQTFEAAAAYGKSIWQSDDGDCWLIYDNPLTDNFTLGTVKFGPWSSEIVQEPSDLKLFISRESSPSYCSFIGVSHRDGMEMMHLYIDGSRLLMSLPSEQFIQEIVKYVDNGPLLQHQYDRVNGILDLSITSKLSGKVDHLIWIYSNGLLTYKQQ